MKKLFAITAMALTLGLSQPSSANAPNVYTLSPGLAFSSGWVGPSFNSVIGIAPVSGHEFYVGIDLSADLYFPGGFAMYLGLLPTAWYQYQLPSHPIKLVGGIAIGPAIGMAAGSGLAVAGVGLEVLFRPGVIFNMGDGDEIGVDLKLGVLGSSFIFKPTVNFIRYW